MRTFRFVCLLFVCCTVSLRGRSQSDQELVKKVVREYKIDDARKFAARIDEVNRDIADKGIVLYEPDNRKLLTGYAYHEMYDWDLYFENLYMSYFGISDYCFTNLKSFLNQQCVNGFIARTLIEKRERQHFKPFLAQIAELGSRQTGDYTWLEEKGDRGRVQIGPAFKGISYFDQLMLSIDYWTRYCDFDRNGLPVWNSSDHSGMDNQISRAGKLDDFRYEGVDLACYVYRELKAMQLIAERLGKTEKAGELGVRAALLADKINTIFWDERDGFYYDRDEHTGELVKVKSAAGFLPLWAGIVSPRRAERLVKEHLDQSRRVLDRVSDSLLRQDRTRLRAGGYPRLGLQLAGFDVDSDQLYDYARTDRLRVRGHRPRTGSQNRRAGLSAQRGDAGILQRRERRRTRPETFLGVVGAGLPDAFRV